MKLRIICFFIAVFCSFLASSQNEPAEQMATYYFQNKEYEKAIELYETLFEKSQNKFYYQQLLTLYLELGRFRDAEKLVERQMKLERNNLTLYVDLGFVYLKSEKNAKAEKEFQKAIEKIVPDAHLITNLARAFENIKQFNYAIATYQEARNKMSSNKFFVFEMATLYEEMGDFENMMKEYLDYLEVEPAIKSQMQIFLQRSLSETNNPKLSESLRNALAARIQKSPNSSVLLEMMIWFSLQQKDFDFALKQAKAIDVRFPQGNAEQVFKAAKIAFANEAFPIAEEGFAYLIKKGKSNPYYINSKIELLSVKFHKINKNYTLPSKDLFDLIAEYEQTFNELGKNIQTIPIMRNYANLLAFHVGDIQKAADILYEIIDMQGISNKVVDEVKLELGDILIFGGEMWESTLLYMQVEKANKDDIIGALAKLKNAKLSYYKGDFEWAKSQLDVLRASTSKLVANDAMELSLLISDNMEDDSTFESLSYFSKADLLIYQNRYQEAWSYFDSITQINLSHALFDEILMRKAQICLKQNKFIEADSLLQQLITIYNNDILADDALFMLGDLYESQFHNREKALEFYEKILIDYSASLYVVEARKRYNALRKK